MPCDLTTSRSGRESKAIRDHGLSQPSSAVRDETCSRERTPLTSSTRVVAPLDSRRAWSADWNLGHRKRSRCRQASACFDQPLRTCGSRNGSFELQALRINRVHEGGRRLPAATTSRTYASVNPASWQSRINAAVRIAQRVFGLDQYYSR